MTTAEDVEHSSKTSGSDPASSAHLVLAEMPFALGADEPTVGRNGLGNEEPISRSLTETEHRCRSVFAGRRDQRCDRIVIDRDCAVGAALRIDRAGQRELGKHHEIAAGLRGASEQVDMGGEVRLEVALLTRDCSQQGARVAWESADRGGGVAEEARAGHHDVGARGGGIGGPSSSTCGP